MAVFGPSGAGKTFTSLRIATGMGSKIAVIDTERGSASRYADRFEFDVLELPETNIETYIAAMAAAHEYDVLIVDSMTHAWHALLEEVDRIALAKYKGNTWSAWSEGTPRQRAFVDALLRYPGHVIATMRSKTAWSLGEDSGTKKSKPVRVGLAPEQGKGIEYEFDILMEMNVDHYGTVIKDRTGKFQDRIIERPGEDFGAELLAWLSEGKEPEPKPEPRAGAASDTRGRWARPMDAETVREALRQKATKLEDGEELTGKFRNLVAGRMNDLFGNDDPTTRNAKRHSVLLYVFGVDSSSKLTKGQCRALYAWSTDKIKEDGQEILLPNEHAIAEALAMVAAYEEQQSQTRVAEMVEVEP